MKVTTVFYFITTVMWKHKASYSYEENQDSVADARFTSWFTVEAVQLLFVPFLTFL